MDEVGFHFDVTTLKVKDKLTDCDAICEFLRIPQERYYILLLFEVLYIIFPTI